MKKRSFTTLKWLGATLIVIFATVVIFACGGGGSDSSDDGGNDEPKPPEHIFKFSCTPIGGDACDNYYGNASSGCGAPTDTYSTNKCPADGALGVCTVTFPNGYTEWVPYHIPPANPSAEIQCTSWLKGTWSDTYTGE